MARETIAAAVAESGLAREGGAEVSLCLADDARLQALNLRWRGVDKPTNVLSFPSPPPGRGAESAALGDIALAYETLAREANELGAPLADHYRHLVAHGFLHLIGYDHGSDEEAERMEALESRIMARLGAADPYAREVVDGWAGIIAAIVVTIVVLVVVMASRRPPAAAGEIVQVWAYPSHGETSGIDANGDPMAKVSFDQVLLFAHLKLKNQSKVPLQLQGVLANLMPAADGIPLSVSAGSVAQYEEALLAYPELQAMRGNAFPVNKLIQPGESVEGTAFWVFRLSKQEWETRKNWGPDPDHDDPGSRFGLNFTFAIQYQKNLVLAPQSAVREESAAPARS